MNQQIRSAYDNIASRYDQQYLTQIETQEDKVLIGIISSLPNPAPKRILDIGCGTGMLLRYLPQPHDKYVGIDCSSEMLRIATANHPENRFLCMYMEDISSGYPDFRPESFSQIVGLFGSFSYCENVSLLSEKMNSLLVAGGSFFLMGFGRRISERKTFINNWSQLNVPYSVYSAEELKRIFRWASVCDIYGFNTFSDNVVGLLSDEDLQKYLELEFFSTGKRFPDLGYYVCVVGTK